MPKKIDEYETMLSRNPIFVDRTKGVGVINRESALEHGFTGPCLRASGVQFDVRTNLAYCGYETYEFDVPWSREGDVYARYMVRMREMRESGMTMVVVSLLDNSERGRAEVAAFDDQFVRSQTGLGAEGAVQH